VLAIASAVLSCGVLPAAVLGESNESESSQQEGPASNYATVHYDLGTRLRRSLPQRHDAGDLTGHLPSTGRRLSRTLASSLSTPQLSLGLSVPLRC
jgi:hypothetical protein